MRRGLGTLAIMAIVTLIVVGVISAVLALVWGSRATRAMGPEVVGTPVVILDKSGNVKNITLSVYNPAGEPVKLQRIFIVSCSVEINQDLKPHQGIEISKEVSNCTIDTSWIDRGEIPLVVLFNVTALRVSAIPVVTG